MKLLRCLRRLSAKRAVVVGGFALLAVHNGLLPPTINYEHPDPECDLDYVPNEARKTEVDVALSNAMGLGGHNACVLVGRVSE